MNISGKLTARIFHSQAAALPRYVLQHGSLLTGMIRDHADRPMSPSHPVKKHRRYRYYVSSMAAAVADGATKAPALCLPAVELEQAVVDETVLMLSDRRTIMALPQVDALALQHRIAAAQALASTLQQAGKAEVRKMLQSLGIAILVCPDRIEASISQRHLVAVLDGAPAVIAHPASPPQICQHSARLEWSASGARLLSPCSHQIRGTPK